MKKIILSFALLILLSPKVQASFTDVSATQANKAAIDYVEEQGIVKGYPDGSFKPASVINRAEFTKIIVSARAPKASIDQCVTQTQSRKKRIFKDIEKSAWFEPFVCMAKKTGAIGGYPDGTFKPNGSISVAEASKIIVGSYGLRAIPAEPPRGEPVEPWYQPYLSKLISLSALSDSILNISPADHQASKKLTRGEMADMIYRLRKIDDTVISKDGLASVKIPEALLPEGTLLSQFSITPISEHPLQEIPGAPMVFYRLEPHGVKFPSPITLQISTKIMAQTVPIVFLVSGDAFELVNNPIIDLENDHATITTELFHFSELGVVFLDFLTISDVDVSLASSPATVRTTSGKEIIIHNSFEILSPPLSDNKIVLRGGEKACIEFPAEFDGSLEQDGVTKNFSFTATKNQASHCPRPESPETKAMKDKVIELTNVERAKVGAPPVVYNAFLEKAAQGYAEELFAKNYLEHYSPEGVGTEERILDSGYLDALYACDCGNNFSVGENLGKGQKTPEEAVKGWMNSPSHRENLLKSEYRDLGIGIRKNTKTSTDGFPPGGYIWVQNFGFADIPTAP